MYAYRFFGNLLYVSRSIILDVVTFVVLTLIDVTFDVISVLAFRPINTAFAL